VHLVAGALCVSRPSTAGGEVCGSLAHSSASTNRKHGMHILMATAAMERPSSVCKIRHHSMYEGAGGGEGSAYCRLRWSEVEGVSSG
jgi:hypothetical protein